MVGVGLSSFPWTHAIMMWISIRKNKSLPQEGFLLHALCTTDFLSNLVGWVFALFVFSLLLLKLDSSVSFKTGRKIMIFLPVSPDGCALQGSFTIQFYFTVYLKMHISNLSRRHYDQHLNFFAHFSSMSSSYSCLVTVYVCAYCTLFYHATSPMKIFYTMVRNLLFLTLCYKLASYIYY